MRIIHVGCLIFDQIYSEDKHSYTKFGWLQQTVHFMSVLLQVEGANEWSKNAYSEETNFQDENASSHTSVANAGVEMVKITYYDILGVPSRASKVRNIHVFAQYLSVYAGLMPLRYGIYMFSPNIFLCMQI